MYTQQKQRFYSCFGHQPRYVFSAPGRTELNGNHTDHQHGRVLAAAVNLETVALVAENGTDTIRIQSEGYPLCQVELDELAVDSGIFNTTAGYHTKCNTPLKWLTICSPY